MSINNIILTISIFFTFWWTSVNIGRFAKNQRIPSWNFIFMSIGWTAIITHIIGIW